MLRAVRGKQAELVEEKRFSGDLEQRLGRISYLPAKTGTEAAGENADGRKRVQGSSNP
jgi:hypothetical protein